VQLWEVEHGRKFPNEVTYEANTETYKRKFTFILTLIPAFKPFLRSPKAITHSFKQNKIWVGLFSLFLAAFLLQQAPPAFSGEFFIQGQSGS
jgi:hypothetical protein